MLVSSTIISLTIALLIPVKSVQLSRRDSLLKYVVSVKNGESKVSLTAFAMFVQFPDNEVLAKMSYQADKSMEMRVIVKLSTLVF